MTTPPQKIGRYEIRSKLGQGGMAAVFQAYDPRFERIVALKMLPREFLHETEFRARFEREAKTIAALEHPAIVPVYDFGEQDGQPYLVMRYMPGGSLAERLQQGAVPLNEAAVILKRIASALDRAHSRGIIHRDLKPGNILFDQYGDAFLADFGIAHLASSTKLTASGLLVGTPAYMSPEQVYSDKKLDGRSDIYALGVILFQMLTGQTPYEADTPAKVMMKHVLDPVPHILQVRPDLPAECEGVISRAMAKERDERFTTASEMSDALTAVTRKHQIPIPPAEEEAATTQVAPSPPEPVAEPPTPRALQPPPLESASDAGQPAAQDERSIPIWVWIAGAFLLFVFLAMFAVATINGMRAIAASRRTPTVTATVTAAVTTTATATEAVSATAEATAGATGTIAAMGTATPLPEMIAATATAKSIAALNATRESIVAARETEAAEEATPLVERPLDDTMPVIFGPEDGRLLHQLDDTAEAYHAGVNLDNFILRATLGNPFSTSSGPWDTGLLFRQTGGNNEMRLVINSDGSWSLNDRRGSEDNFIQEGDVGDILETGSNGRNQIILVAQGERGYFFLNETFVALLDLSSRTSFGDVAVATGFYSEDEQEGAFTLYEAFTIWDLSPVYGPRDGELTHIDDGLVKSSQASVARYNFIAEATFYTPYDEATGNWDLGYAFRETEENDQFWLIIESNSQWSLYDRQQGEDVFIEGNMVKELDIQEGGPNRATLIALNDEGYLLVNDLFAGALDLGNRPFAGDIKVVTAYFTGNEVEGEVTRYEDFTIWPLP